MYHRGKESNIYLGVNAGRSLLSELEKAKHSVKIVSPYLSPKYTEKLIKLKKKGVKITLITTGEIKTNNYSDFRQTDLIKQKKHIDPDKIVQRNNGITITTVFFFLSLLIGFSIPLFFLLSLISAIIFIQYKNMRTAHYSYYTIFDRLRVYHYDDIDYETKKKTFLIHSKIYVIDNKVAYLGSLNFTYNGLVQSYESGIKIKDKDAIKKISKEIDLLFQGRINTNGKEMFFRDINEWGKSLYDEPNN